MPSLKTVFIPHNVNLNTGAGTAAWINQVAEVSPDHGVQLLEESSGSETDREFVCIQEAKPTMPIVTSDLSLLGTIGYSGLLINSGAGAPGLTAWGRAVPFGSLPTAIATAAHLSLAVSDGLLVPMSVSVAHNQAAMLHLMLHAALGTDGTSGVTPFVWATSQSIPSGASQAANFYTTGPVKYTVSGGSARYVLGQMNLSINFGLDFRVEGDTGNVYPQRVYILGRMTSMEFSTRDAALIAEIGDGVKVSAFAMYFQQMLSGGQRVAAGTATHISVSGTAGMIKPGGVHLVHKQPGMASFTYTPVKNTNEITISTTSTIPTS